MGGIEKKIIAVLPRPVSKPIIAFRRRQVLAKWEKAGRPLPPPHPVKQLVIEAYATRFGCSILVETGTYRGDMMQAEKYHFSKLYSIELSKELWQAAVERFKNDSHITILNGDSGKLLYQLAPTLDKPTLFWLDGHYSGGVTAKGEKECPVYEEVDAILVPGGLKHVLLIDDARLFVGTHDYPTIEELTRYIKTRAPQYSVEVEGDIIRVTP